MRGVKRKSLLFAACLLAALGLSRSPQARLNYTISEMNSEAPDHPRATPTAFARHFTGQLDADGFPPPSAWHNAPALQFERDWKGENPDSQRATEVRLLWTSETLFVRFYCHFRSITVFPDAREDGWRDKLWDRDVAETFLQPDESDPRVYREFEVSPNGHWIDLAVAHGKIEELHSGLRRRVMLDEKSRVWIGELALPMKCLTPKFDPKHPWRANFFRVEGESEPRFYAAWSPTRTEKPNFHVPSAFGTLIFRE